MKTLGTVRACSEESSDVRLQAILFSNGHEKAATHIEPTSAVDWRPAEDKKERPCKELVNGLTILVTRATPSVGKPATKTFL